MKTKNIYTSPIVEVMMCAAEGGFALSEATGSGYKDYTDDDLEW